MFPVAPVMAILTGALVKLAKLLWATDDVKRAWVLASILELIIRV